MGLSQGFQPQERTAVLRFEGDFEGAEVRVRLSLPSYYLRQARRLFASEQSVDEDLSDEYVRWIVERVIIDWNLLDMDGAPIPLTFEDVDEKFIRPEFMVLVLVEWVKAVSQPADPLLSALDTGNGSRPDWTHLLESTQANPGN